jgi:hypothetical protein
MTELAKFIESVPSCTLYTAWIAVTGCTILYDGVDQVTSVYSCRLMIVLSTTRSRTYTASAAHRPVGLCISSSSRDSMNYYVQTAYVKTQKGHLYRSVHHYSFYVMCSRIPYVKLLACLLNRAINTVLIYNCERIVYCNMIH